MKLSSSLTPTTSTSTLVTSLPPPTLLPPPPPSKRNTSWAALGGPLPSISVLENRLQALQESRSSSTIPKTLPKERNKGVDLCFAAHSGDVETAENLLENKVDPNFLDFSGRSPLHLAASAGCLPIVSLLLQYGASLTLPGGSSRLTALHFAAEAGYDDIVQLLCARGADVEALSFGTGEFAPIPTGLSPLCIACERGHYQAVVALCKAKADINSCFGLHAQTPLFFAASSNRPSSPAIVSHLVSLGADYDVKTSFASSTIATANQPKSDSFRSVPSAASAKTETQRLIRAADEETELQEVASDSDDYSGADLSQRFSDQTLESDSDDDAENGLAFSSLWEHPSAEIRTALNTGLMELRTNLDNMFLVEFPVQFLFPMAVAQILDYLCLVSTTNQQDSNDEIEEQDSLQTDSYESLWD